MANIRINTHKTTTKTQVICVDSCKISLKGKVPQQKKGWRRLNFNVNLNYTHRSSRVFSKICEIYYKGERIGALECHPKALLDPESCILSIDNRLLYSKNWTKKVKSLFSECNWNFSHLNMLDVACDSNQDPQNFIKKYQLGKIKTVGKSMLMVKYKNGQAGQSKNAPEVPYFRWGERSGDKFMRVYNKKDEISKSNKGYIREFWERNKLNIENVFRWEISCKHRYLKELDVFQDFTINDLSALEDSTFLRDFYKTRILEHYKYVSATQLNKRGKNVSRCTQKPLIRIKQETTYLISKIKSRVTSDIYKAKMSIKMMYQIFMTTNYEQKYRYLIEEYINNFGLRRWFNANEERFRKDFDYKKDQNGTHNFFPFLLNYASNPKFTQQHLFKIWNTSI
jgi:hypothetical protein